MLAIMIFAASVAAVDVTPVEMQDAQGWCAAALGAERAQSFFSFVYDGRASSDFLSTWKTTSGSRQLDSQRTAITLQFADPISGLEVRCEAVQYADFPTVEWTLSTPGRPGSSPHWSVRAGSCTC